MTMPAWDNGPVVDDRATDADRWNRLWQTAGERRERSGLWIDPRDPADGALGDVKRTIGTDRAADGTL